MCRYVMTGWIHNITRRHAAVLVSGRELRHYRTTTPSDRRTRIALRGADSARALATAPGAQQCRWQTTCSSRRRRAPAPLCPPAMDRRPTAVGPCAAPLPGGAVQRRADAHQPPRHHRPGRPAHSRPKASVPAPDRASGGLPRPQRAVVATPAPEAVGAWRNSSSSPFASAGIVPEPLRLIPRRAHLALVARAAPTSWRAGRPNSGARARSLCHLRRGRRRPGRHGPHRARVHRRAEGRAGGGDRQIRHQHRHGRIFMDDLAVMRHAFETNNLGLAATFHPFIAAMNALQRHPGGHRQRGVHPRPGAAPTVTVGRGGLLRELRRIAGRGACAWSPAARLSTPLTRSSATTCPS